MSCRATAPYRTTPEKAWQHDLQIKADFPGKIQKDGNKTDIGLDSLTPMGKIQELVFISAKWGWDQTTE